VVDGGGLSIVLIQTLLQSMGSELKFEDYQHNGVDMYFDLPVKDLGFG
jgi:K+-sensing histidine kinase KdpD